MQATKKLPSKCKHQDRAKGWCRKTPWDCEIDFDLECLNFQTGCFQNDKGDICQCQSKSLGNKRGCWVICPSTSTQTLEIIIIASPARAYLDKKRNISQGILSIGRQGSWRSGGCRASNGWLGSWSTELCGGQTKGCSVNWTVIVNNEQKENPWWAVRNPPHWKGANTRSSVIPITHWCWMHFPLCPWGWRQGVAPATALHIASTWKGNPPFVIVALAVAIATAIAVAILLPLQSPLPIAIAVGHCRCGCRQPSLLPSLLHCHQPSPSPLPLPSVIAFFVTVGQRSCHLHLPALLPSPLAISECCCLGMTRIVFDRL